MTDHQALRDHLQWFLVGSLHYSYIDAGAKAISLVVAGRGENLVETPEREILSAAELVEEWSLGEFVEAEVGRRDLRPRPEP